ncbi:MAG: acyl-CoA dehydratase activase-related protein [Oscillospiraceae bacterium]|nr:acyl-CoA dehydratase activase-related protein [Oscillospiraceae bacterium]
MTIGIPRALGYHRYGTLWETFFKELGLSYVVSGESNRHILAGGVKHAVDESCLPLKLYLGHAASLLDRCDLLLVPRFERLGKRDEFCVRFWGLPDTVRSTFTDTDLLTYELKSPKPRAQQRAFLRMGYALGIGSLYTAKAYQRALTQQLEADFRRLSRGRVYLRTRLPKILIAANPYITYDPLLGGTVARLIRDLGAVPIFVDGWPKATCREEASALSTDLYWHFSREILGAIHLARERVDGVILLTAFPCGSDCLSSELVLRRVDKLPVTQILLDEHQSHTGLQTRLESFLDMIRSRGGVPPPPAPGDPL